MAEDYPLLNEQIMGRCEFSIYQAKMEFHCWLYWADTTSSVSARYKCIRLIHLYQPDALY